MLQTTLSVLCRNCHYSFSSDSIQNEFDISTQLTSNFSEGRQYNVSCPNCGYENKIILAKFKSIPELKLPEFRREYFRNRFNGLSPIESIKEAKECTVWSRFNL